MKSIFTAISSARATSHLYSGILLRNSDCTKPTNLSFLFTKNDRLVGFVQSEFLKRIPEYKWDVARAEEIAVNIDFIKIQLGTPLHRILGYMLFRNLEYILVVDKTKVLGIIEREKLMNIIKI